MRALKNARRFIETQPEHPAARILADLVLALENQAEFRMGRLYQLDLEHFQWALALLEDWRIDGYYTGKARLFDLSWQHRELQQADRSGAGAADPQGLRDGRRPP